MTNSRDLSPDELKQVFTQIDIPTCPSIVNMAMTEAQKEAPDIRKLCAAIEKDVGMSALTIKLANSPLFRTSQPISMVSVALARLGIRNVVCIVIAAALRTCMTGVDAKWLETYWNNASLVATAASMIAKKQHGIAPDIAYTFALFHDAAIPLLRKRFENYCEVISSAYKNQRELIEVEEEFFPCTHPIVGSLLARNWGLPSIIGQAIRFHHEADVYNLPESTLSSEAVSLIATTHVAERLLALSSDDLSIEVGDYHYESAMNHLGISAEELDDIREALADEGTHI